MGGRREEGERGSDKEFTPSEDVLVSAILTAAESSWGGGKEWQKRQKASSKSVRQRGGHPV